MARTARTTTQTQGILARLVLLGLLSVIPVPWVFAGESSSSALTREYQFKAAFLYHFTKFIEWPAGVMAQGDTTFSFCVMGSSPLELALDQLIAGKQVRGRMPMIKRVSSIDEIGGCQVLFISRSEHDVVASLVDIPGNSSVLTVGDTPNFAKQGGIIEFIIVNNKLRFVINLEAAKRARLKLSSELLKLAQIVYDSRDD